MNGIPHLEHLRSASLFGLSSVMLIFDDESENDWNRAKVLERLSQVTLPPGVQPQMGTDWSPVGQIYFFTLHSTNPQYDVMELKSLEDWIDREAVQVGARTSSTSPASAAPRASIRCASIPNKLIAYGLSLGQVEQQLTNNNVNGGGSFIEAGLQQINVRAVGQVQDRQRHRAARSSRPRTARRCACKDIATVAAGRRRSGSASSAGRFIAPDGQHHRQRRRGRRHRAAAKGRRLGRRRSTRSTPRCRS